MTVKAEAVAYLCIYELGFVWVRYDPGELWDTTMNPETRTLKQITAQDAVKADEIFTLLMGEKVEPRREYIENNAVRAMNLDI